jgi:hypothetical protein
MLLLQAKCLSLAVSTMASGDLMEVVGRVDLFQLLLR